MLELSHSMGVYGQTQVCRGSKYKPFLNCLQIPSDLTGWVGLLGTCLCLRSRQSYLACQCASDSSLRWFQPGSRKQQRQASASALNKAADGHVVWTVVVLCSTRFINSSWEKLLLCSMLTDMLENCSRSALVKDFNA